MTLVPRTAKLYLRIATLRRQMIAQDIAKRAVIGGVALGAALIGLALLSLALYLWLSTLIGQIAAVLVLAGLHVMIAIVLAIIATRDFHSAEMEALAQTEEAAYDALAEEAAHLTDIPGGVARAFGGGSNVSLAISAATTLLGIVQKMRGKPGA